MTDDVIIVNHIKQVVAAVNIGLQEAGFSTPVYYDYGHPLEISKRLQELTQSAAFANQKFPLIILFTDITIDHAIPGFYGWVNLHMLVCNITDPLYTSVQRTDTNFIPILHPIKNELINQLQRHIGFSWPEEPTYKETDCYFYGSVLNGKNVFNDYIDAIELRNVRINLHYELCELTTNI
jgi:hypothetical protein